MFKSRRLREVVAIWLLKLKKFQMLGEGKKKNGEGKGWQYSCMWVQDRLSLLEEPWGGSMTWEVCGIWKQGRSVPHSPSGPHGSPEKEGPAMTEFLLCHGVKTTDGSWVLSDSPTLADPLISEKGRGGGTSAACWLLSNWGYFSSQRGQTQLRVLASSWCHQSYSRKPIPGLILTLLENSQVPSGCWGTSSPAILFYYVSVTRQAEHLLLTSNSFIIIKLYQPVLWFLFLIFIFVLKYGWCTPLYKL